MEGFYSVREMTRKLGVESHMLRYWEKELKLDIPRDSHGHRIYGEEEARLLTLVSDYKKAGKPLRLIRTMITLPAREEGATCEEEATWTKGNARTEGSVQEEEADDEKLTGQAAEMPDFRREKETGESAAKSGRERLLYHGSGAVKDDGRTDGLLSEGDEEEQRSQRLQDLLSRMVAQAVRESSEAMITEMKESILKELDYQFRLLEEREAELRREVMEAQEDHFQRMDSLLRNKSEGRKRRLWK